MFPSLLRFVSFVLPLPEIATADLTKALSSPVVDNLNHALGVGGARNTWDTWPRHIHKSLAYQLIVQGKPETRKKCHTCVPIRVREVSPSMQIFHARCPYGQVKKTNRSFAFPAHFLDWVAF